jgi:hypothetical protein
MVLMQSRPRHSCDMLASRRGEMRGAVSGLLTTTGHFGWRVSSRRRGETTVSSLSATAYQRLYQRQATRIPKRRQDLPWDLHPSTWYRAPLSKCLSAHKPSRNSSLRLRELGADVMRQQRPRHPRSRQMESLFLALLNRILERRIGWREGRERASVISAPPLDKHRVSGRCTGRQ